MNGSTPYYFNTPSRKPTEHHCNADKKNNMFYVFDQQTLASVSRNLFSDSIPFRSENISMKMFR